MQQVIVHTIPGCPFARAALATLEEKRVPWRIAPLRPGQHREAEHLVRHPFGRMPAIEHDGFTLDFLAQAPEWTELTAAAPNIVAWFERVRSRPSFAATTWERVASLASATALAS